RYCHLHNQPAAAPAHFPLFFSLCLSRPYHLAIGQPAPIIAGATTSVSKHPETDVMGGIGVLYKIGLLS
ncbi:MAG: hypothetical protein ACRC0H_10240, partial [Aeromonas sobria]